MKTQPRAIARLPSIAIRGLTRLASSTQRRLWINPRKLTQLRSWLTRDRRSRQQSPRNKDGKPTGRPGGLGLLVWVLTCCSRVEHRICNRIGYRNSADPVRQGEAYEIQYRGSYRRYRSRSKRRRE